jgi:acetyl-CoA acetyltransferase
MSLRGRTAIVGIGESDIGNLPHMTGLGLNAQAARRAIDDAGLKPSDIDGLLTAYSMTEPYFMLGSVLAEYLGLKPRFCASMVVGGATPGSMLIHAAQAIAAGQCETVLICAGENRASGRPRDQTLASLTAVGHPYFEAPYGASIPALYALIAKRHMAEFGTTREQLAAVAVNTRRHAALHPAAQMRKPIDLDDVMTSRPIADPLGKLDCCLISDAGGALVVTSAERARDLAAKPVYVLGAAEKHTHEHLTCAESITSFGAAESGRLAFAMAGLRPADVDVAQLYDCFTITVLLQLEDWGFCKKGEGGPFVASGEIDLGGTIPINTGGGHLSEGYIHGMNHIVEGVRQVRGTSTNQVAHAETCLVTCTPLPPGSALLLRSAR